MDFKANLRDYYNIDAERRNVREKTDWKIRQRDEYLDLVKSDDKSSLLELGAGSGQDSEFFMSHGLTVTAVDLSPKMVEMCRARNINAHEMDFYNLSALGKKFDCIWAMNSLLHVPKSDLPTVLHGIADVMNDGGLFYMGVYGGEDKENHFVNDLCDTPRYFAMYTAEKLKPILSDVFDIVMFREIPLDDNETHQSVIMRKK